MEKQDTYKIAYERERTARINSEDLLDEMSRSLYQEHISLQQTLEELKLSQTSLIQSEKMASIGQLAAGVAHEINNPIGFSLSNLSTLTEYIESFLTLDSLVMTSLPSLQDQKFAENYLAKRKQEDIDFLIGDLKSLLADSIKGLNRVSEIVKSLKKVTHAGSTKKEYCNLKEIIEESIKIVWNELKYTMTLEKNYIDMPMIECNTSEIQQVLMNLLINAAHACEDNQSSTQNLLK